MTKRKKEKIAGPNEIVFGDVTRADLDQLIYGMLSVRVHNNMVVPECFSQRGRRRGIQRGLRRI